MVLKALREDPIIYKSLNTSSLEIEFVSIMREVLLCYDSILKFVDYSQGANLDF